MAIDLDLTDKVLADYKKPEDIIGENGMLRQLTKALLERAMQAEITDHLGYAKHDQAGNTAATRVMAYADTVRRNFQSWILKRHSGSGEKFTGDPDSSQCAISRPLEMAPVRNGHIESAAGPHQSCPAWGGAHAIELSARCGVKPSGAIIQGCRCSGG